MHRFLLSPLWLAFHLAILAAVVGFCVLGWWQLEIYGDSTARSDRREEPAVPISQLVDPGDPVGQSQDRAVVSSGTYLDQLVVPARVHDGVLGAFVVAPLHTPDGILVVLRGWTDTPSAPPAPPTGVVSVRGHIMAPETVDHATGGEELEPGQVRYLSRVPVARVADLDQADLYAGVLVLRDEQPAGQASLTRLDIDDVAPIRNVSPWQNLSYWAQWWIFAAAAVVFWFSAVRSAVKSRRRPDPDAARAPSPPPSVQQ